MASLFTKDQQDEIERHIGLAIEIQSTNFGKLMASGKEQADAMVATIASHNEELHRNADSVRALVNEANAKSAAIESSMTRIAEAEGRLATLTSGIEAFAVTQDQAIQIHTAKLGQLTADTAAALQGIDGKLESAVSDTRKSAIVEFSTMRQQLHT